MNERMRQPCAVWAEKLAATHSDDLSTAERIQLDAHLRQCAACAAVHTEYRLIDALIRAYPCARNLPDILPSRLALPDSQDCDTGGMLDETALSLY